MSCPTCGKKHKKKRSKMWLFPVIAVLLLVNGLLGPSALVLILWGVVALWRAIARQPAIREYRKTVEEDNTPVAARMVGVSGNSESGRGLLRTATRGAIGGLLGGAPGFAIGVATAKVKTKTTGCSATFIVDYASGRRGAETVEVGSDRYNWLSALEESRRA